jgi:hypothetical protein
LRGSRNLRDFLTNQFSEYETESDISDIVVCIFAAGDLGAEEMKKKRRKKEKREEKSCSVQSRTNGCSGRGRFG